MTAHKLAFIVCSPRTGSTLLTRVLNSHSAIASPCEIPIPKYFQGDPSEQLVTDKLQEICAYYQADFCRALIDFNLVIEKILRFEQKELLAIKYPRHSLFMEAIVNDYPDTKYIHLVRDVRSVAMSQMYKNKAQVGFRKWYQFNTTVMHTMARLNPDKKLFIRYEDMLDKPVQVISKVIGFLGYKYEPGIVSYGRFSHADDKMKLWWNKPPNQARVHKNLACGEITKFEKPPYTQTVKALYNEISQVKLMNQSFGYQ